MLTRPIVTLIYAAAAGHAAGGNGCAPMYLQNLDRPSAVASSKFGHSVGITEEWAVVGAPDENGAAAASGVVHFYRRANNQWTHEQALFDPQGHPGAGLGYRSAISGNIAIAGAPFSDLTHDSNGAVLVFRQGEAQWSIEQRLVAPDANAQQILGIAVSVEGSLVVVGAAGDDDEGYNAGAAYIFRHNGGEWILEAKLAPPALEAENRFGSAVAQSGDQIFVAAPSVTGDCPVYRYRLTSGTWELVETMRQRQFGMGLAATGDCLLIRALWTEERVYAFDVAGPNAILRDTISRPSGGEGRFGSYIAASNEHAIISSPRNNSDAGAVHAYRRVGADWQYTGSFLHPTNSDDDAFGVGVALSGRDAIVGAPFDEDAGVSLAGAASFIEIDPHQPGDADGDGDADFADITAVLSSFNSECPGGAPFCSGDADASGMINFADVTAVLTNFGLACP